MARASESAPADAGANADADDTTRLAIAPGTGLVARRDRALLYLPGGSPQAPGRTATGLIERFRGAEHDRLADVLTGHVLDEPEATPAFVYITWPTDAEAARIEVIVRGDVQLVSDLDSMPFLSGAGSATWVEHRVPGTSALATFSCGASVDADTDLRDGLVRAGGVRAADVASGSDGAPGSSPGHADRRPTEYGPAASIRAAGRTGATPTSDTGESAAARADSGRAASGRTASTADTTSDAESTRSPESN